jgi:hypothetical protein
MPAPLIVATTAINRPALHADVLPGWIAWVVAGRAAEQPVHWFVNIDLIEKLAPSFEETRRTFEGLCAAHNIELHVLRCEGERGNFLKACQRLATHIDAFVQTACPNTVEQGQVRIVWLEDDWRIHPHIIPLTDLLSTYSAPLSVINLSYIRNNYIHALAPSVTTYPTWKRLHYEAWKRQGEVGIDPEHCVGKYYIAQFGKLMHVHNLTVINKAVKPEFLTQGFMNESNSMYTFHRTELAVGGGSEDPRFVEKSGVFERVGDDRMLFVRITPSACMDGVDCGRNFLEERGVFKTKGGTGGTDFYTTS